MNEAAFVILHCLLIQTPNYYQLVKNKMNILLLLLLLLLIHINIMYFAILELSFLPLPHFFTQQHSPEDIYIYIHTAYRHVLHVEVDSSFTLKPKQLSEIIIG